MIKSFSLALMLGTAAFAEGERAGEFDYYVMALSWNPGWCEMHGDRRSADQCDPRHDSGFTLHGLWPQNEVGWPSFCRTPARDPSRQQTSAMADIMGSGGLAWYQWKKHGRCSGLSSEQFFETSRAAYDLISRPEVLRQLPRGMYLHPDVIEDAFLEANPGLSTDGITVTCKSGKLQEVRICLTKDLDPRDCSAPARRGCTLDTIFMDPVR